MSDEIKGKVLIVEDDKNYAEILKRVIMKNEYEINLAYDGKEGLELSTKWKPDVIIVDWMMPGMSGIELISKLREHPELRFSYIIMLTARVETEDKITGLEAGADDFITKPVDFGELIARIRVGFRIKKLQSEIAELQHESALLEMARTLGHEINNPLNIIYLALELINRAFKEDNPDKEKIIENLNRIHQASERIKEIVNKLISLRKPAFKEYVNGKRMLDLG
ncbi:His Kinase A (phospho-acceptor) domain-containing protein [Candidatus Thermokryptus mobilis]|uniref:histidine kinase n=1 Tax=Candidatus Thermokryptus mobilis TaxID=1643428 RepID=A0A0S4MRW1_9BACT|nr:response regulator [Candidatus Thermokryptus mobilis]CUU01652.1 His Kinase A (phospho-acceptor) domain-containing protein [Candidatus Thermokryptus mobilis]